MSADDQREQRGLAGELDRLESLRANGTPGVWGVLEDRFSFLWSMQPNDAVLICAAVNALPDLIAATQETQLRREAERHRDVLRTALGECPHRDEWDDLAAERDRLAAVLVNLAHPHGYGPLCEPDKYVACAAARLVAERGT